MKTKLIQYRVNETDYKSIKENADDLRLPVGAFSRISTLNAVETRVD